MSRFILDACSIIAFVNAEEGSGKMKTLLENAANEFYMHMETSAKVTTALFVILSGAKNLGHSVRFLKKNEKTWAKHGQ